MDHLMELLFSGLIRSVFSAQAADYQSDFRYSTRSDFCAAVRCRPNNRS